MATPVDGLWLSYQVHHSKEIRDRLIEVHIPLVEYVARRMLPRMHSSVELQDLIAYGTFGLMDAIERFDIGNGVKFSTFASYRIQGSITDELRSQAWEPRSVRSRYRQVLDATAELEHRLGRLPSVEELATHVGITPGELHRIESDVDASRVGSLDAPILQSDGSSITGDQGVPTVDPAQELDPQMHEAGVKLANGLGHLTDNERLLLRLIYVSGVPLKGIAESLGVTESWVSHLHTKVMVRLQRTLAAQY